MLQYRLKNEVDEKTRRLKAEERDMLIGLKRNKTEM